MQDWKKAKAEVLAKLVEIRRRIAARDESGTLELVNEQDAFCGLATEVRDQRLPMQHESKCHFCEGYTQGGGCLGRLEEIDRAVLHGEWAEADRLVAEYAAWVERIQVLA